MTDLDTARRAVAAMDDAKHEFDRVFGTRQMILADDVLQAATAEATDLCIALVRSLAPSAWQPIESAPRDGEWIMLGGGKIVYGWYAEQPPLVVGQWTTDAGGGDEGRWQFAWYDGGYYGEYEAPTHWMPLPEPPAIIAALGGRGVVNKLGAAACAFAIICAMGWFIAWIGGIEPFTVEAGFTALMMLGAASTAACVAFIVTKDAQT